MGILENLWLLLTNPAKAAAGAAVSVVETGQDVVCAVPISRAIAAEQARQQRCDWWAKNGVLVGAGAMLALVIIREQTRKGK